MTLLEAKSLLTRQPLQFGNDTQIQAVKLLSRCEELIELIKDLDLTCQECDGEAEVECPECNGTGKTLCDDCSGTGDLTIPENVSEDELDTLEHEVDVQLGRITDSKQLSFLAA